MNVPTRVNYERLDVRRWMESQRGTIEDSFDMASAAVDWLSLPPQWLDDPAHWIHEEAWLNVMV